MTNVEVLVIDRRRCGVFSDGRSKPSLELIIGLVSELLGLDEVSLRIWWSDNLGGARPRGALLCQQAANTVEQKV